MRICIVPRWGSGPDDDWYPWLRRELACHEVVTARLRPTPGAPEIAACVGELRAVVGEDPAALAGTLLVGHSVGAQACVRFAAALPSGACLAGVVAVAGWWWVDDPSETMRPWIETPVDRERARAACRAVHVLLSDDDPFTRDHAANARQWERALGASVHLLTGARHLNRAREPAVLDAIRALVG